LANDFICENQRHLREKQSKQRKKMPSRKPKKENLPQKICPICQRPFSWRKKWERNWDAVVYCSERCRRNKSVVK
jgi:hypothetical protein